MGVLESLGSTGTTGLLRASPRPLTCRELILLHQMNMVSSKQLDFDENGYVF